MCTRGHWRPAEDERLRELVERYGPHNWNAIAEKLQGRSGKSCRLRWFNQLDPRINRSPFTEEEEELLLTAHRIHGNRGLCRQRSTPYAKTSLSYHPQNPSQPQITPRFPLLLYKLNQGFPHHTCSPLDPTHCVAISQDQKKQAIEFYDFLQVNTDSNRSEVTDNSRRDEDEEVINKQCNSTQRRGLLLRFLVPGKLLGMMFLSVKHSSLTSIPCKEKKGRRN
ncbi:Myb domain protein 52 isoform 2 [Hibiscus syriacus]|uniref:Myb domain protein 52 isoform 2 n=1 Tax=Hibiscus syriacus TaxID=106335 RepID=A0A6A3AXW4_HIBSY|nr:Myb domain protein 52 isoform 2 [Hibiscus syriacus]